MRLKWLSAAASVAAFISTPGVAKGKDDLNVKAVAAAMILTIQGKSADALAAIEAPLASYDAQFKNEKRSIFCARDMTETLLYLTTAAAAKRDAVAIPPGWCDALFIKGYALVDQNRVAEGLPYLEHAAAMAPNNPHFLNEVGFAHGALHHWPESLVAYRQAAASAQQATPDRRIIEQTRALRGIGYALVEQGKWDEAASAYRDALKVDPKDAKSLREIQYIAENRPRTS